MWWREQRIQKSLKLIRTKKLFQRLAKTISILIIFWNSTHFFLIYYFNYLLSDVLDVILDFMRHILSESATALSPPHCEWRSHCQGSQFPGNNRNWRVCRKLLSRTQSETVLLRTEKRPIWYFFSYNQNITKSRYFHLSTYFHFYWICIYKLLYSKYRNISIISPLTLVSCLWLSPTMVGWGWGAASKVG